ncbi:NADH:flavin oxidoreductase/NADH oxidase [Coprinopsis sp. MPI-PUGE-AT-0042]|nr:NADH:flavin oxidoreductase/NADH oxidase [Coprinopsis sp. MPI-PUGE-AT-0042]
MAITNTPAPNVPYFTPAQTVPAGTARDPQLNGVSVPALFKPLTIRGVAFQNRTWYSAKDGFAQPWHNQHQSPVGMLASGPRITSRVSLVEFAHTQGQKKAIQLAHAGRKASNLAPWAGAIVAEKEVGGWPDDVWGPSPVPFHETNGAVKELTHDRIKQIVQSWADAAKRSTKAGFDVIEVHTAHGFLLHQFLSPQRNKRTDEYGRSFENRIRSTVEVVDPVQAVIPEITLFVLPNEPAWRAEDTARLATVLVVHGVDLLDVSSGGNNAWQKIRPGKAYQAPFAEAVKKAVGSKMLVGAVLEKGMADAIFVGRMFQKNLGMVWQRTWM